MSSVSGDGVGPPGACRPASNAVLLWLMAGVALTKLAILVIVGPSVSPDTAGYVAFSDAILDGTAFAPVGWGADATPIVIFRTAGYPLILAAAKLITPAFWAPLVVILQGALNIAAMVLIFRVAERLFATSSWAVLATLLYAYSQSLLWDNSLLIDSIYGSLFNIVIFALLGSLLECWRLSRIKIAGLAVLWGYSLWTRDNGLYFTYLPALLLLFIRPTERGFGCRRLAHPIAFLAVVAAMVGAYELLNLYRTGEAFFSITGLLNFLRPLFDMLQYGYADPFTGDDLIARTVRETMITYDFPAQVRFIATLHERCLCTPTQLQSLLVAKYITGVLYHPLAYLRLIIRNFDYFDLASALADPVCTINQFVQLGTPLGTRVIPGLSIRHLVALWRQFSVSMMALMILAGITKLISGLVFTLFMFGIPRLWLREWRHGTPITPALWAVGFLWFAFIGVTLAYSLVHFEARHALPVFPAAQMGIVYMLWRLDRWRHSGGGWGPLRT